MPTTLFILRQDQLRSKIIEAIELGLQEQVLILRSKWVHRYGFDTLHDSQQQEKTKTTNINAIQTDQSCSEIIPEDFISIQENSLLKDEIEEPCLEDSLCARVLEKKILEEKNNIVSSVEKIACALDESTEQSLTNVALPPPTPALNHLRRWLPDLPDNQYTLPKAS